MRPRPRLIDFLRRRALRIVPAYWLALTALAIFPGLVGVFTGDWWRYYGFLQIYSSVPLIRITGISVAWSLCIEVSFYLALPFYAALTRRFSAGMSAAGKVRFQLACLGLLGTASLMLGWGAHGAATPPLLLTFFDWFALGMGLGVVSVAVHGRAEKPRPVEWVSSHPGLCWASALAVYALLTALVANAPQHYELSRTRRLSNITRWPAVALALVAPAVFGDRDGGWPRQVLSWRWMRWLGLISYGIFLWHLPLLMWLYGHGVPRLRCCWRARSL